MRHIHIYLRQFNVCAFRVTCISCKSKKKKERERERERDRCVYIEWPPSEGTTFAQKKNHLVNLSFEMVAMPTIYLPSTTERRVCHIITLGLPVC